MQFCFELCVIDVRFYFRFTYVINHLIPANSLLWAVVALEYVARKQKELFILNMMVVLQMT